MLAVCGGLLLVVGLVFGQTLRHGFVNFDDDVCVYENPQVTRGFSGEGIVWALTNRWNGSWVPLTWISHMLDWQLHQNNAGGHHLTNLVLHAATTVLLFLVFCRMTGALWPSALMAAVFAVHPLQVEAVAWVTARKDVLSGLFFVLVLWAYTGYVRSRGRETRGRPVGAFHAPYVWYLATMFFFVLGLMAKPALVTLPFVLLLLDYWPLGRYGEGSGNRNQEAGVVKPSKNGGLRPKTPYAACGFATTGCDKSNAFFLSFVRLAVEKLPLLALTAVSVAVTVWAQDKGLEANEHVPLWWRIANAPISYVFYIGKLFYPLGLATPYPRLGMDLPAWKVLGSFLTVAGVTTAALIWRRKCPYFLVGWFWYLGMLLPVIGLVQFGAQAVADRFMYLPQIGLELALAWGAADLSQAYFHRRQRLYACGVCLAVAVLAACAWRQTAFWRNSETLFRHTLACDDRNCTAHNNLANFLIACGRMDEAASHFRQALAIWPDYVEAHNNLGNILISRRQLDEAASHFQQALKNRPDYAEAHNNLGNALASGGQLDEAAPHFRRALEIQPNFAEAHYNLGVVLAVRGRLQEAMLHFRQALENQPGMAEAHYRLGNLLAARGQSQEAVSHFRKALQLAIKQNKQALADALQNRITLYESGKAVNQNN